MATKIGRAAAMSLGIDVRQQRLERRLVAGAPTREQMRNAVLGCGHRQESYCHFRSVATFGPFHIVGASAHAVGPSWIAMRRSRVWRRASESLALKAACSPQASESVNPRARRSPQSNDRCTFRTATARRAADPCQSTQGRSSPAARQPLQQHPHRRIQLTVHPALRLAERPLDGNVDRARGHLHRFAVGGGDRDEG